MNIAAVFTGGTIGSSVDALTDSVNVAGDPPRHLLERWSSNHPGEADFEVSEPFRILSEDATPAHWEHLARHLKRRIVERKVDAIVLLHGSDTLPWTASALAFALRGIPIPLVLVAADRPLDDVLSNGHVNFDAAMSFIREERLPGVFVVWAHPGEEPLVYLGTRLQPADPLDDRFSAPRGLVFGRMEGGRFVRSTRFGNPGREDMSRQAGGVLWTASLKWLEAAQLFAPRLLVLPPHPGLDTGRIALDLGWQGILQLPYHSGTASSTEGDASTLDLARRATERNLPFLLGPCAIREVPYASTKAFLDAGARLVPAMSTPAAMTKLMFLLGTQGHIAGLDADFAFELV